MNTTIKIYFKLILLTKNKKTIEIYKSGVMWKKGDCSGTVLDNSNTGFRKSARRCADWARVRWAVDGRWRRRRQIKGNNLRHSEKTSNKKGINLYQKWWKKIQSPNAIYYFVRDVVSFLSLNNCIFMCAPMK